MVSTVMVPLLFVTAGSKSSGWMIDRSNEPDVAISREVDTCSISTGDGWTEGRNRFGNSFGLRSVKGTRILAKLQELGCV
jgi:hypothetical protein